jgi:signal transduction histidine kinase
MDLLLTDLLELVSVGRAMQPAEEVGFGELAHQAKRLVAGAAEARGVKIIIAPDLPVVRVDRVQLVDALVNLLSNAIKFMGDQPAPQVEVGVRQNEEKVFYVRDNGIGIREQDVGRVMELFKKLDPATTGSGLGLPLVRKIVEVHGGRLWVESEGPGHGATFCFTLSPDRTTATTTGENDEGR